MLPEPNPTRRRRARLRHVSRTVLTLGAVLLLGVSVGLPGEIWLRETGAASGILDSVYTSVRETLALALGSLQAAAPLVAALVAAPLILAGFLRHLYGVVGVREAQERLNRVIFGALGGRPHISVREGRVTSGGHAPPRRLGGPAYLTVYGDTAAVTERYGRLARILGTGVHTLRGHETIWETIDLRPQRWVRQVFALTMEGIPITCEVDVVFQVGSSDRTAHGHRPAAAVDREPPPPPRPTDETILRAATSTWVRGQDGRADRQDFSNRVASMAEGAVRDTLATYHLDSLIGPALPGRPHPRDEVHARLREILEQRVQEVGVGLVDVKVGEVRVGIPGGAAEAAGEQAAREVSQTVSDLVSGHWIDAWHAKWQTGERASRAGKGAEPLSIESARVEAQAEMIVGLAESLQPLIKRKPSSEPHMVAQRLVEAIDWMSPDPQTRDHMPPEAGRTLTRLQRLLTGHLRDGAAGQDDHDPHVTATDTD